MYTLAFGWIDCVTRRISFDGLLGTIIIIITEIKLIIHLHNPYNYGADYNELKREI